MTTQERPANERRLQNYSCNTFPYQSAYNIATVVWPFKSGGKLFFDICNLNWTWNLTAINLSPPSAAYMRQWIVTALVQMMACRLFGAKPSSKPMLGYCRFDLRNKLEWNVNQNTKLFIHKNASENIVCKMAAILSRGRWVNPSDPETEILWEK